MNKSVFHTPKIETKQVEVVDKNLINKYQKVFGSPEGQDVLADLEKMCYIHNTTFTEDPCRTAYREGMRQVLLTIKMFLKREE